MGLKEQLYQRFHKCQQSRPSCWMISRAKGGVGLFFGQSGSGRQVCQCSTAYHRITHWQSKFSSNPDFCANREFSLNIIEVSLFTNRETAMPSSFHKQHIIKNTKIWYTIDALGAIFAIFTIFLQYYYNTITILLKYF